MLNYCFFYQLNILYSLSLWGAGNHKNTLLGKSQTTLAASLRCVMLRRTTQHMKHHLLYIIHNIIVTCAQERNVHAHAKPA